MGPSPQRTSYNPLQGSNLNSTQLQNTRFSPQSSSSIPFSQSSNYPGNFIGYQGSVLGANTGTNQNTTPTSSGGSSPSYSREDLAYIDAQLAALGNQEGRLDNTLRQSLDAVLQNYNKQYSDTTGARGRAIEDFNTKFQTSDQGRQKALGQVETNARTLADSLRRRIGMASGSGSSAYQITAPGAVAQQASDQRSNVLDDYSQNFLALDRDKKRAEEDFNKALTELNNWRSQSEMGVQQDIGNKRNEIAAAKQQAAAEKAKLLGGGYQGIRNAMAPYEQQINERNSFLDGLYDKYASKYQAKPVQVANTQLRDYAVDNAAVADNEARGNTNETAPYRTYLDEEESTNPLY